MDIYQCGHTHLIPLLMSPQICFENFYSLVIKWHLTKKEASHELLRSGIAALDPFRISMSFGYCSQSMTPSCKVAKTINSSKNKENKLSLGIVNSKRRTPKRESTICQRAKYIQFDATHSQASHLLLILLNLLLLLSQCYDISIIFVNHYSTPFHLASNDSLCSYFQFCCGLFSNLAAPLPDRGFETFPCCSVVSIGNA